MPVTQKHITIGMTACANYRYYHEWLVHEPGVELVCLDPAIDNIKALDGCDGIVLTGGQDIHPGYYGMTTEEVPGATGIDAHRDAFEWRVLERATALALPLLGICRGLQLANAFFGGTLIGDLPAAGKDNHSKYREGEDRYHRVSVKAGTLLARQVGMLEGEVNSAHHQAADIVAPGLVASAWSADGVIEALEWEQPEQRPYLMLVQWHPERMASGDHSFSQGVRENFLSGIRAR